MCFFVGFEILSVQGRCYQNFQRTLIYLVCMQEEDLSELSRSTTATPIVFVGIAGLLAPRRLSTAPTQHGPATLTSPAP
jgi:hypothetical protein